MVSCPPKIVRGRVGFHILPNLAHPGPTFSPQEKKLLHEARQEEWTHSHQQHLAGLWSDEKNERPGRPTQNKDPFLDLSRR